MNFRRSAQRVYMRMQHVGPVLALGAPCPGVDFEVGVVAVGLAGEQRLDLQLLCLLLQRFERRLGFLDDRGVALGLAELDQLEVVAEPVLERRARS